MINENLNLGIPQTGDLVHFVNWKGHDCIGVVRVVDGDMLLIFNRHTTRLSSYGSNGSNIHKDKVTVLFRNNK